MARLNEHKAELGSVERTASDSFGAGGKDSESGLGDHAMNLHRRSVGNKKRCVTGELLCDEVGVSRVFAGAAEFSWNDDEQARLQPRDQTALHSFVEQAASSGWHEARDFLNVGQRERRLGAIVECRQ